MVTDSAVLPDSPRSKDTYMDQANPSVTWLRCVHQFDSRFSQFVRSQMKFDLSNSCGHDLDDPQQYIFLVKMILIIKTIPSFL